jgi:hypothetical protein
VTTAYFIIELIVGVIIILIAPDGTKVAWTIQTVLATVCVAWLLAYLIANEHTADSTEWREMELQYVKGASTKIYAIIQQIADKATVKRVERIYDVIHSSPAKSNIDVRPLEQQVLNEIARLEEAVAQNETEQIVTIADKIYRLANERNNQLTTNRK